MSDGEWANQTNKDSLEYDWQKYQQQVADERENWERRFQLESAQQMKMLGEQAATDVKLWKQTQSPQAIVKAAQDVGLNPAVILGKTGGTPSITPAAVPSPSTPVSPGGTPGMVGYNQQDPFLQLSEIVQGLSDMSRTGVDAYSSLKQLPSILGNRLADTAYKESMKEYQDLVNVTYSAFGSKQAAATFLKTFNEGILAKVQGDTEKARKLWLDAERELFGVQTKTMNAELPFVATKMKSVINNLDSATEANKAAAQDSRTHAHLNTALGSYYDALRKTEDDLRQGRVNAQTWSNWLSELSFNHNSRLNAQERITFDKEVAARFATLEREGLLTAEEREKLYQMQVSSDWAERQAFADYCGKFATILEQGSQSYGNIANGWSQPERNHIRQQMVDIMNDRQNKVHENYTIHDYTPEGHQRTWTRDYYRSKPNN